jgi:hypothetical protein
MDMIIIIALVLIILILNDCSEQLRKINNRENHREWNK